MPAASLRQSVRRQSNLNRLGYNSEHDDQQDRPSPFHKLARQASLPRRSWARLGLERLQEIARKTEEGRAPGRRSRRRKAASDGGLQAAKAKYWWYKFTWNGEPIRESRSKPTSAWLNRWKPRTDIAGQG